MDTATNPQTGERIYKAPSGQWMPLQTATDPETGKRIFKGESGQWEPMAQDFRGEGGGKGSGLEAFLIGARDGVTLGFGDEINAGVRAAGDVVKGAFTGDGPESFGAAYDERLVHERGLQDQAREENPIASTAGQVAGAVALPGGAVKSLPKAMGVGGLVSGVTAFGEGEGGLANRAADARDGAATGALFTGALGGAQKGLSAAYRGMVKNVAKRPTTEALGKLKNVAYQAVDDSGETFTGRETDALYRTVKDVFESSASYVPEVDKQGLAALRILEKNAGKELKVGQLDKIRQGLWKRYNAAPNEDHILDAIGAIDDVMDSRAGASDLMTAAREANKVFSKSKLLEKAFLKADRQTASTGSGGNIANKYRQAVTSILNNPKQAKWFSPEEIAMMDEFIEPNRVESVLRTVGKISPGGNGLMTMLNLMSVAVNPAMIAAPVVGMGAKEIADRGVIRGADRVQNALAGVPPPPAPAAAAYRAAPRVGGALGGQFDPIAGGRR